VIAIDEEETIENVRGVAGLSKPASAAIIRVQDEAVSAHSPPLSWTDKLYIQQIDSDV
jgi:hypothetical protein